MNTVFVAILIIIPVYTMIVWGGSWLVSLTFPNIHVLNILQSMVVGFLIGIIQYFFTYGHNYGDILKTIAQLLQDIHSKMFEKKNENDEIDLYSEEEKREKKENYDAIKNGFYYYMRYLLFKNMKIEEKKASEGGDVLYLKVNIDDIEEQTIYALARIENIPEKTYDFIIHSDGFIKSDGDSQKFLHDNLERETRCMFLETDKTDFKEPGEEAYFSDFHAEKGWQENNAPVKIGYARKFGNSISLISVHDKYMGEFSTTYLFGYSFPEVSLKELKEWMKRVKNGENKRKDNHVIDKLSDTTIQD